MEQRSPAQLFALLFGGALVVGGIIGFFYNASFATGSETLVNRDAALGILDVNGWHNVFHLVSGLVGLAVVGSYLNSRAYALVLGVIYTVVTVLGFAYGDGDSIFKLIPINTEDNILHVLIALAAFGAYFATPAEPAPTTAQRI